MPPLVSSGKARTLFRVSLVQEASRLLGSHPIDGRCPLCGQAVKEKELARRIQDALLEMIPILDAANIGFVVVSGDMIEGTITATLLERANPGAISARKDSAGRLYNVGEFAAEIAAAAVEPIPENHTRLVGDVSDFGTA